MSHHSRLVTQITAGDREAFADFLDLFGSRVLQLARRYATDEADAEDLTQDIFLELHRSIATYRGEAQLATWVYRVALNCCLRHQEKRQRQPDSRAASFDEALHETRDRSADPTRRHAQGELADQVQHALDGLSGLHRDVVILHEFHGLTYTQCAAVLGVPVGTVKSRLSNAFRSLRGSLGLYVLGEAATAPRTFAETKSAQPTAVGDAT